MATYTPSTRIDDIGHKPPTPPERGGGDDGRGGDIPDYGARLARRSGAWERVVKWSRRRPAAAALVGMSGVALLTLVGLGVGLVYHARLQAAYDQELSTLY